MSNFWLSGVNTRNSEFGAKGLFLLPFSPLLK
jgi:hypothetical protein